MDSACNTAELFNSSHKKRQMAKSWPPEHKQVLWVAANHTNALQEINTYILIHLYCHHSPS